MTIGNMRIGIKRNITIVAAALFAALLLFDIGSVSAFKGNGRPSGSPPYRSGQGGYNGNHGTVPGPKGYRSYPRPDYHPGDRAPGRGPWYYRNDRGPGYYPADRVPARGPRFYRQEPFSPYGGPQRGGYGERRAVQSRGDAQRMLNDYYTRRSMRIGPIRENKYYYEADILDRNNRFMDRVIIDKGSGRIRSIY